MRVRVVVVVVPAGNGAVVVVPCSTRPFENHVPPHPAHSFSSAHESAVAWQALNGSYEQQGGLIFSNTSADIADVLPAGKLVNCTV
jgi:hypothetical protein